MVEGRSFLFPTRNLFEMQEEHENIVCQAMLFFNLLPEIKDDLEPSTRVHVICLSKRLATSSIF